MTTSSSSSAHTPGPWFFDPSSLTVLDVAVKLGVATVYDWNNRQEAVANGHLIAAAPQLFDACRLAVDSMKDTLDGRNPSWMDNMRADLAFIEAAIAKARGN